MFRRIALVGIAVFAFALTPLAHGQCVSLTTLGSPYTQNFDTLSNTAGSTTNNLTIPGWFMTESGGGARDNEQYAVDTGASTTGDTYSYGAAASTERALGQLRSGTLIPLFGACFTNNTGSTINTLAVSYNGEEWRLGTAARTDQMNFEYSLNATDLVTGTWTNAAALNFVTPDTATTGAKNGNAASDRTALSSSISSLTIANGATFWIRWNDQDASGADDGLAVDDFSLTPQTASIPLSGTGAANPSVVASGDTTTLTVTVTPANTPPSTGITVTGDLTSIGGSPTQAFFDNGTNGDTTPFDNIFTFATTATGSVGTKTIPVAIADAQARNAGTNISLNIVTLTPIHDIQGNGDTSPLVTQSVTTRGIVTGVRSNGYFIELPDAQWDADPATSEGVFVFTSSAPPAAAVVGNMVTVTGTVSEFIPSSDPNSPSQTELTSPTTTLVSSGNPLPTAITITTADTNPAGTIRQLEKYAGMRVHVATLNVVGPTGGTITEASATSTSNGTFYGVLPGIGRPFREPGIEAPDPIPNPPCCIPRFDLNPERIRVNSSAIGGGAIDVTAGATVTNITGPLDYGFRAYTIDVEPATVPGVSGNVTFTAVPAPTATEFTVGCQNIERFFDDINDSNGAVTLTTTAYNNRKNKASLLVRNVLRTPDILGVEEAETLTGLQGLAAKINADAIAAAQPNPNYTAYLLNGNDIGGINVGVLVNATRVTVNSVTQAAGSLTATYTDPTTGNPAIIWDRPPLVVDATIIGPPAVPVVVIVNHLRSLSGIDDTAVSGLSTNGDRVRQKRRAGAEWLANYIQGRLGVNPNERLILVGDFNAFQFNDGYVDVMGTIKGTPTPSTDVLLSSSDLVNPDFINLTETGVASDRYSYNFDGDAQSIDHILINNNAALQFSRFAHGRVDADFPEFYRNDSTRPERLSDHDGEVVYFSLTPTVHFDVSIPASVNQGVAFTGTVTARDAFNNVATTYNGTIHFTSSDGGAALPTDYTFTGGDAGTHTFTNGFTLFAAGSQSITATDTLTPTITGVGNTTVLCPGLSASPVSNSPICQGSTLQLDSTDIPGATYSWTGPNGFTAAVRNPSIASATTAATGLYSLTINNAGCIYNGSTSVTVDAMPTTPTITADTNGTGTQDQACPEQPLTLHANSTGATSYQWYQNNDTLNGETGSTYQATGAANYYVTATNGSCTTPQSAAYLVQNPTPHAPFISFRGQDSSVTTLNICQGSSQIIDSDSATGIQWYEDGVAITTGGNNQSYTFISSTPGTHTFTAQLNALGCHSQFGRTVTINIDAMPPTPSISGDTNATGTQDQACPEQPLTLHANGATGATSYTWYSDNAVIPNETTSTLVMTGVGNISVTATNGTCTTAHSATYVVQNPTPHSPFISIRNQDPSVTSIAVCQGTTVILDSDSATGIVWWEDGAPMPNPQAQSRTVTDLGTHVYTAQLNALGCHSQFGRNITVTINPPPATPTITPSGPTTFCTGGSVTLTSSSATGNQWLLNGSPIGGATGQTYPPTASGDYSVKVTDGNGCSATSAITTVTINPAPNATITAPSAVQTGTTGNTASVANAGAGATYNWSITNGTITAGTGTNSITFTAGAVGTLTLNITVTDSNGCSDSKSANVTVTATSPSLTITSVVPSAGLVTGGKSVTVHGTGFVSGATLTFGGSAATNVVFVNATTLTAKTPAHAAGAVNVTVTNPNHATATLNNGYTYVPTQFDPNGDHLVNPSDIFYLVNFLFLGGPPPAGAAGMDSGDANNDGVVDPSDIFYVVSYLYLHGPAPASLRHVTPQSAPQTISGALSLGEPVRNGNRLIVPVMLNLAPGSEAPHALALRVGISAGADNATIRRAGAAHAIEPAFEISRRAPRELSYLLSFDDRTPGLASGVIAEIELDAPTAEGIAIDLDPAVTLLSSADGTRSATVAGGTLHLSGTSAEPDVKLKGIIR
jgi:predicted extracellular nuclease